MGSSFIKILPHYPVTNQPSGPYHIKLYSFIGWAPSILPTDAARFQSEQAQHDNGGHIYNTHFSNQLLIIMLFVAGWSLCYLSLRWYPYL